MLISDITALLDRVAPPATAESWDNPGLQIGSLQEDTTACLLALDVNVDTVREAKQCSAGLILCHHPLVFGGLHRIDEATPVGRTLLAAARARITVYAAHTNLDLSGQVGTAVALAEQLGLVPLRITPTAEGEDLADGEVAPPQYTLYSDTPPMPLDALARYTEAKLATQVALVGDGQQQVRRVAVLPGSGGGLVAQACGKADAVITGEIKYHEALEARELGLGVIAAGHYETERPVLNLLSRYLKEATEGQLQVAISQVRTDPFWTLTI
ncbi:Nif3-like dinuclear metal center hexameric protein [bacterium]|nr:Nif3-like dinuclear metal center hexameric protein [bacterium]